MARIGIFGGSFNPIHNGHVHLAECAKRELSLDKIILVPTGFAPHKSSSEYVSGEHRLNMCALAVNDKNYIEVSRYEIDKGGKSYTIHTLKHFKEIYHNDELFLLIGSDMLLTFDQWYKFEEIMKISSVCAFSRVNTDLSELEQKAEKLRKFGNIFISHFEGIPMSSSMIRQLIKNNKDFSCYLPKNVVQYIKDFSLYGELNRICGKAPEES